MTVPQEALPSVSEGGARRHFLQRCTGRLGFHHSWIAFRAMIGNWECGPKPPKVIPLRTEAGKRIVSAGRTNRGEPSNLYGRPDELADDTAQAPSRLDSQAAPDCSPTREAGGERHGLFNATVPVAPGTSAQFL